MVLPLVLHGGTLNPGAARGDPKPWRCTGGTLKPRNFEYST